ncbi:hypothetical protein FRB94_007979 [Tulasnella sp. JGI-2019a]|nr:hypothetical protein FRB93_007938 [Tulasnella sp. JGI-2019a]KAG8996880.1 hypothetical protein FRB94_007979 [Tulasnella sp. JGI-2019a]
MGPPVAIIVGSTIVGVGVVVAIHEAWPYIKPRAQEFYQNCSARYNSFRNRRRHRAQPHSTSSPGPPPSSSGDDASSTRLYDVALDEDISLLERHRSQPLSGGAALSAGEGLSASGLRQRHFANRDGSEETLMNSEVEMVHLDQSHPLTAYTSMTPTRSQPESRPRAGSVSFDVDPFHFEEPSVPVASAIPLPLSPSSSTAVSTELRPISTETPGYLAAQSRSSTGLPSYATAPSQQSQTTSTVSTPNLQGQQPPSTYSTVRRSRHQPSASQTSIPSAASVLSPPAIPSAFPGAGAKSPAVRATSPSGASDTMSFVSAAPSRTWTDGGTADIFSGDERDFQEANEDSDDDVQSVSESGSWESVSAAGRGDGNLGNSQRLPRRQ